MQIRVFENVAETCHSNLPEVERELVFYCSRMGAAQLGSYLSSLESIKLTFITIWVAV